MDQLLVANPALEQVGPFAAGTADTEAVNTRYCIFLPNRYMTLFLDDGMTPRQAWQRLRGALVADGLAQDCARLVDWLLVALTRRTANVATPLTRPIPAVQAIGSLNQANLFQRYRAGLVHRDHPNLLTNQVTQGAHLVAQGLTNIVQESRLSREADEVRRSRDTNKTPADLFTTGLPKLMRWCQVQDETLLPPLYEQAARARKGDRRKTLQSAVNDAMETLG
jgi:hypothetical protein